MAVAEMPRLVSPRGLAQGFTQSDDELLTITVSRDAAPHFAGAVRAAVHGAVWAARAVLADYLLDTTVVCGDEPDEDDSWTLLVLLRVWIAPQAEGLATIATLHELARLARQWDRQVLDAYRDRVSFEIIPILR